jgi:hypothetical protein
MLAADCQAQRLRCVWREAVEPAGHALRVEEFLGIRNSFDHLEMGILGIRRVKAMNGLIEALSVSRHRQSPLVTGDEMWGCFDPLVSTIVSYLHPQGKTLMHHGPIVSEATPAHRSFPTLHPVAHMKEGPEAQGKPSAMGGSPHDLAEWRKGSLPRMLVKNSRIFA